MNNIIRLLEISKMKKNIPNFNTGDLILVKIWVLEGSKKRIQQFEGTVIAKRNRYLQSSFTIRKISNGEGVERVFPTHSPIIESILLIKKREVRKSKLYYIRHKTGKSARIKNKLNI